MSRNRIAVFLAAAALLIGALVAVPMAIAAGAGAVTTTDHEHQSTNVSFDYVPCADPPIPGRLTTTENGVFHVTYLTSGKGAGTYWVTGTFTGTFLFEPIDSALVPIDPTDPESDLIPANPNYAVIPGATTYTGHFTVWFGANWNLKNANDTETFTVHGTGSDGSIIRFHETAHFLITPNGVEMSFDKVSCP